MEQERKVVEPSAWDRWRAALAEKRALKPHASAETISSMFAGGALLVFAILWKATVATSKWLFNYGLGVLLVGVIVFSIAKCSTYPTSELKEINIMWEQYPVMRPHITEAASDGIITKWENLDLGATLRKELEDENEEYEKDQLQRKIEADQ